MIKMMITSICIGHDNSNSNDNSNDNNSTQEASAYVCQARCATSAGCTFFAFRSRGRAAQSGASRREVAGRGVARQTAASRERRVKRRGTTCIVYIVCV